MALRAAALTCRRGAGAAAAARAHAPPLALPHAPRRALSSLPRRSGHGAGSWRALCSLAGGGDGGGGGVKFDGLGGVQPGPRLALLFTCGRCGTRSAKTFSKMAYEEGIVVVRCGGCENLHLVADNLGWFGPERNVEDIAALMGKEVGRLGADTTELMADDLQLLQRAMQARADHEQQLQQRHDQRQRQQQQAQGEGEGGQA